ncbi:type II toxin-antitoxin system RelE/ParE family toxin [Martelella mediterranea]|nr:type II toxin-antitoxin system RelE/ParE family toxin [Martelella mediterranea]
MTQWGQRAADKYHAELFARFEAIAASPLAHPSVDFIREGYRRAIHKSDSIYYRTRGEDVEIMAIIGRQDLDNWL